MIDPHSRHFYFTLFLNFNCQETPMFKIGNVFQSTPFSDGICKCKVGKEIHPLLAIRIRRNSQRDKSVQKRHNLPRLECVLRPLQQRVAVRIQIVHEVDEILPHLTSAIHVEDVRPMHRAEDGERLEPLAEEAPDVRVRGDGVLEQPASRGLEDAIALEGCNTLELRSQCIEDTRVEGGALRNVSSICGREGGYRCRACAREEDGFDIVYRLGVGAVHDVPSGTVGEQVKWRDVRYVQGR